MSYHISTLTSKNTHISLRSHLISPMSHHISPMSHHISPMSPHISPMSPHISPISPHISPMSHHIFPMSHHTSPTSHPFLPFGFYLINESSQLTSLKTTPEATSLEYKHVVFRKPYYSATEKSGVHCVQNIVKNIVVPT
jgi:hypothetical protein